MQKPTMFVLLRALVWAIAGLVFGVYGLWVWLVDNDTQKATLLLVVALNFDASYFQLAYHYDLRLNKESPDAP